MDPEETLESVDKDMLHIKKLDEGLDVFKALGSELRIRILNQLLENPAMNMNTLAASLGITNGGLTLFGSGFGNYGQDIRTRISYSPS